MSTDRQQLLDSVAKAVADGAAVNWDEADSAALDPEAREMLRQLRIVAEIADLHRKTVDEDDPSNPGLQTADAPPQDAPFSISDTWAHLTLREVIGRGAYGTVYRAWDAQLDRDVALKLIPEAVDRHYAALVIEEARLMARVHHPNVVTVYGATRAEGCVGLWMELIEGQTLEQILQDRGRFSAREAALIGCDVCEALAAVHSAGLLHRDVKAHNVMRNRDGRIVLMDFGAGLEQTMPGETPVSGLAGTPLYMAPELFRGGQASVRSDVYSVGVLLYRLVTGRVPINARSLDEVRQAHLSGNVRLLRDERSDLPSAFVQIVERALNADPARRFDSAGGFEMALTGLLTASSDGVHLAALVQQPHAPPAAPMRRWLLAGAGLLLMLVIAGGVFWAWRQRETRVTRGGPTARFIVYPPANTEFESLGMSPDGRMLAFTAGGSLWVRALDALEASNLSNTAGSHDPFWSPDGKFIAYFKSQSLWIVPAAGGESRPLCAAWNPSGGSWAPDNTIIFAADLGRAIYRVSAQTGERQELRTQGTHGFDLQWPSVLPNGDGFIYSGRRTADGPRGIFVGRFDQKDDADRWLMATDSNAQVADGRILFVRDGLLMAQPFNTRTLQVSGMATRLADRVPANLYVRTDYANFSVGGRGPATLAFLGGTHVADREINIVSRDGNIEKLLGASEYRDLAISHSARELAYEDRDSDTGARDIWIADIARKQTRRLATTAEDETAPVWSADDREIFYTATRNGRVGLYRRAADGLGDEILLFNDVPSIVPYDLTAHGLFAFTRMGNDSDIWTALLGPPLTRTPFRATRARENEPRFSPDGNWVAYSSTDSGSRHVYIEQVSAPGKAWQVSVKNGREPQWRQDGKEIYYHGPDRQLMAVAVDLIPNAPHIGDPVALFTLKFRGWDTRYHYAAYPDGQRFIVASPIDGTQPMPVTIVLNWTN